MVTVGYCYDSTIFKDRMLKKKKHFLKLKHMADADGVFMCSEREDYKFMFALVCGLDTTWGSCRRVYVYGVYIHAQECIL